MLHSMILMSFFIIMIIIGKVQHGSVVLPLWELSARGEGGHSLQPPARPHDHHDFKYDLFSWVLKVQKILIVNRDGDRDLTQ